MNAGSKYAVKSSTQITCLHVDRYKYNYCERIETLQHHFIDCEQVAILSYHVVVAIVLDMIF